MKPSRPSATLFEVMNKAPISQAPSGAGRFFARRHRQPSSGMIVAEALSEEEAADALAQQEDERLAAQKAREQRRREKREAKQARRAARRAARERSRTLAMADVERAGGPAPWIQTLHGRLVFSLSSGGCVAVVGIALAAVLIAFVAGTRSGRNGPLPTVAARSAPQAERSSPLVPAPLSSKSAERTSNPAPVNPDLSMLLQRPEISDQTVAANQPARVSGSGRSASGQSSAEPLNYLQIESFLVTRERNSEDLLKDLGEVRRFLAERGVQTFARRRSNGFVLFAAQGFSMDSGSRAQRTAFARRIESLGQEYRNGGGLYQFKGCFFVSESATRAGEPVP